MISDKPIRCPECDSAEWDRKMSGLICSKCRHFIAWYDWERMFGEQNGNDGINAS